MSPDVFPSWGLSSVRTLQGCSPVERTPQHLCIPQAFDSGLKICQIGFALRSVGHIPQAAAASGMNLPDKVLNYFKLQSVDFKSKAIFYVTALAVAAAWCMMASGGPSVHRFLRLFAVKTIKEEGQSKFL